MNTFVNILIFILTLMSGGVMFYGAATENLGYLFLGGAGVLCLVFLRTELREESEQQQVDTIKGGRP